MSFFSNIACAERFVKRGAVETAQVIKGKVKVPGFDVTSLTSSPVVDTFIRSAVNKNAHIVGDQIVRFADKTMPYRVVTKRLPSGVTVSRAFSPAGAEFEEVLSKGKVGFLSFKDGRMGTYCILKDNGSGIIKPSALSNHRVTLEPGIKPDLPVMFLEKAEGLTNFANAANNDFQALKNLNMVYTK